MKKILMATLFVVTACTTAPLARRVRFEKDWVRTTLIKENYGYRHSERTAPVIDSGVLYQGNGLDGVVAYNKDNGREIWRFAVRNGVESGFAIEDDRLYFGGSDGQFYCLNKITGKPVWIFPTRTENLASPLVTQGQIYFLAGNNILYALDSKSGKQLWVYNRGDASSLSIRGGAKPVLYKGTLYVGFSDGFLTAISSNDGSLLWERKLSTNIKFVDVDATAVVDEENIWVSSYDGSLFSLSRKDGQIQWRIDDGGAVPVTIEGDNLYYSSVNQAIYSLNKRTGTQNWKYSFEEKQGVPTQPILHRGLVIIAASDGDLMALSERQGKLMATYKTGAGVFATPLLDPKNNLLYVYSNQANLYLFRIAWFQPGVNLEWGAQ